MLRVLWKACKLNRRCYLCGPVMGLILAAPWRGRESGKSQACNTSLRRPVRAPAQAGECLGALPGASRGSGEQDGKGGEARREFVEATLWGARGVSQSGTCTSHGSRSLAKGSPDGHDLLVSVLLVSPGKGAQELTKSWQGAGSLRDCRASWQGTHSALCTQHAGWEALRRLSPLKATSSGKTSRWWASLCICPTDLSLMDECMRLDGRSHLPKGTKSRSGLLQSHPLHPPPLTTPPCPPTFNFSPLSF